MRGKPIVEGMVMSNQLPKDLAMRLESERLRQENMKSEAMIHEQLDQIIKLIEEINETLRGLKDE